MKRFINPARSEWKKIVERPYVDNSSVLNTVEEILGQVKIDGDAALFSLSKKIDGVELESIQVSQQEINEAAEKVPASLQRSIKNAAHNIRSFHEPQLVQEAVIETMPGIRCWRRSVAIQSVGLYIPGGTAPLFSTVLMLGIPAQIAGCREVILCTPPSKDGTIHPAILFAAQLTGISRIFKVGGAQAIAAMAYGTETIPPVYKIFGPGNQYVTAAKERVQKDGIAIDMPAGPSEVCVLADETANASFVASDLLSQAEHGADSQVLLVSTSAEIAEKCEQGVELQLQHLPRKEMATRSLENSAVVVLDDLNEALALVNQYAAEHLIINCRNADILAQNIDNAGSIFIGPYTPESAGDYASGTNHTLPTNGFARAYSGLSVDSFLKKITYQKITREGLKAIGETVINMAEAERLQAHANAISIRLNNTEPDEL
jgi:histidinol dehydrogenase